MTKKFDSSLGTEKDWVRFEIADTDSAGMYLEDETINAKINENSKQQAVIDCINHIIGILSAPDSRVDWLTVSYAEARKGYERLLTRKKQEFGIYSATISGSSASTWREDSFQTDGDYNEND